jgi:hypothetical protein
MATIIEALRNAEHNLAQRLLFARAIGLAQLHDAIEALEAGIDPNADMPEAEDEEAAEAAKKGETV